MKHRLDLSAGNTQLYHSVMMMENALVFFQDCMEHSFSFMNLKYSENTVSLQHEMPCHFCLSVSVLHATLSQFC